jgi:hypothetical protein
VGLCEEDPSDTGEATGGSCGTDEQEGFAAEPCR